MYGLPKVYRHVVYSVMEISPLFQQKLDLHLKIHSEKYQRSEGKPRSQLRGTRKDKGIGKTDYRKLLANIPETDLGNFPSVFSEADSDAQDVEDRIVGLRKLLVASSVEKYKTAHPANLPNDKTDDTLQSNSKLKNNIDNTLQSNSTTKNENDCSLSNSGLGNETDGKPCHQTLINVDTRMEINNSHLPQSFPSVITDIESDRLTKDFKLKEGNVILTRISSKMLEMLRECSLTDN